jgi:hypothetical protein
VKYIKIYEYCTFVDVDPNRDLFTKHGLHLNGLGRDVIAKQLVCQIYDRLFKVAPTPIGLGWKNDPSNQDLMGMSSSDEIGSCLDVLSQTNLNWDHPSQSHVLTSINSVANRSSNRVR